MMYDARPGVCGDGAGTLGLRREHALRGDEFEFITHAYIRTDGSTYTDGTCVPGPLQVTLTRRAGRTVGVSTSAGAARPRAGATALGTVAAAEAVDYLFGLLSERTAGADDVVIPIVLAGGVRVWPRLIAVARDARTPRSVRRAATFWVTQAAGDRLIASDAPNAEVRKTALFWLGERGDAAALDAAERILR